MDAAQNLRDRKLAFISVFNKEGVDALARALIEKHGYTILSTGGTYKFLRDVGIPAVETSTITGFDELLGGRVKSLHPHIFAGILTEAKDREGAQPNDVTRNVPFLIDTVIVNLYPFEKEREAVKNGGDTDPEHLLHYIDIGGPSLIRAAAKNFPAVNVLVDSEQYPEFVEAMLKGDGETTYNYRRQLASRAFQYTAYYDALIAEHFAEELKNVSNAHVDLRETISLPLAKITDLRYGENPHQKAALYGLGKRTVDFECLHGKELSYNNILDMEAAWNIVTEFTETAAAVVVKHNNPCGVAISHLSLDDAFQLAFDADPLSAFGGIVAFNQPVNEKTAARMKDIFLEVIMAPDFEPEAFEILSAKKNLRLVKRQLPESRETGLEFKQVSKDLFLLQTVDPEKQGQMSQLMKVVTEKKPSESQMEDMVFAWKVVKHVKSNAIVLAKNGKTVGIGGGQTSRIGALENALKTACDEAKDAVLASDGFLPHTDNIYAAAHARVGAIIQPGGSVKDPDVIELANKYDIPMVNTGLREFRH